MHNTSQTGGERCDLLIHGGSVFDGSGNPATSASVAIVGDRILAVGQLDGWRADQTVDATGLAVAPGFIDAHTHDDRAVLSSPDMTAKVSQGVTTVIGGNCGVSLAPLVDTAPTPPLNLLGDQAWFRYPTMRAYMDAVDAAPAAVNIAMLVGHSTLRVGTMDRVDRGATAAEIEHMGTLVDEAMAAGCVGFSTGLAYPTAIAAPTEEVVALTARAAAHGGLYATHMRNEENELSESVDETVHIGKAATARVVISHHKACGRANWGRTAQTLKQIERANAGGQVVDLDVYPYVASSTVLLPHFVRRAESVMVTWSKSHPEENGNDLEEIRARWGLSLDETIDRLQPAGAIYFQLHEDDLQRVLKYPGSMVGSDGLPHDEHPHPRLWGTFPRVLGHYVRELNLMPLAEAVYKMTGLTARVFGLEDRGVLREGAYADIVVFNPETVIDRGTFADPAQPSAGIETVFVNGAAVWSNGSSTPARPGRTLRRGA
ncbi:MAG: D-aminoacylase [Pseudomonadota bacterium]